MIIILGWILLSLNRVRAEYVRDHDLVVVARPNNVAKSTFAVDGSSEFDIDGERRLLPQLVEFQLLQQHSNIYVAR